jgi:hypothetical protein
MEKEREEFSGVTYIATAGVGWLGTSALLAWAAGPLDEEEGLGFVEMFLVLALGTWWITIPISLGGLFLVECLLHGWPSSDPTVPGPGQFGYYFDQRAQLAQIRSEQILSEIRSEQIRLEQILSEIRSEQIRSEPAVEPRRKDRTGDVIYDPEQGVMRTADGTVILPPVYDEAPTVDPGWPGAR